MPTVVSGVLAYAPGRESTKSSYLLKRRNPGEVCCKMRWRFWPHTDGPSPEGTSSDLALPSPWMPSKCRASLELGILPYFGHGYKVLTHVDGGDFRRAMAGSEQDAAAPSGGWFEAPFDWPGVHPDDSCAI
jgi:hypothetical protein